MASLTDLIFNIPNWRDRTSSEIVEILNAETIDYAESERFTGYGLALIIGTDRVQPFLDRCRSMGLAWVAESQVLGLPIGDPIFNASLLETQDVDAVQIARYGRRKISILQADKQTATTNQIVAAFNLCKLKTLQLEKRQAARDRYNAYCTAVDQWNGDPATEPQL
jgi:hypothetical protein